MTKEIPFLKEINERLRTIIDQTALETIRWSGDLFEDLISCILDVEIKYRGKALKFNRMKVALDGAKIDYNSIYLLGEDEMKYINMSSQKHFTILYLSAYWDAYNWSYLDWYKLSDDEIRSLLLGVTGIGSKTIEMILLYTFQRPDIFPLEDLQLKNVMKKVYEIDDKEDLESEMIYISDGWKPFRSTAVLYLLETAKTMKI